jgi:uncharacterized paraquat-inducible protein A
VSANSEEVVETWAVWCSSCGQPAEVTWVDVDEGLLQATCPRCRPSLSPTIAAILEREKGADPP